MLQGKKRKEKKNKKGQVLDSIGILIEIHVDHL